MYIDLRQVISLILKYSLMRSPDTPYEIVRIAKDYLW
jgi:hypothetical protein